LKSKASTNIALWLIETLSIYDIRDLAIIPDG